MFFQRLQSLDQGSEPKSLLVTEKDTDIPRNNEVIVGKRGLLYRRFKNLLEDVGISN